MRKYLTDFDPKATPRQRAQRERLARAALTKRKRKPQWPKGWTPPV